MWFVYRKHTLPVMTPSASLTVIRWYEEALESTGLVCSRLDITRRIGKRWRREDVWREVDIVLEVPSHDIQYQSMLVDSMDQHWLDIKPSGEFEVHGIKNYSNKSCAICLERSGNKIRLYNCNCLFHRSCIEISVKYRKTCPTCFTTIYMSNKVKQTNASPKKEET
jgi:hypothetical protein